MESLRCSVGNGGSNTVGVDDPTGNTGTTGVAREVATTAAGAVAVVASVEAMVTDAASGEPQEDDGDGD